MSPPIIFGAQSVYREKKKGRVARVPLGILSVSFYHRAVGSVPGLRRQASHAQLVGLTGLSGSGLGYSPGV